MIAPIAAGKLGQGRQRHGHRNEEGRSLGHKPGVVNCSHGPGAGQRGYHSLSHEPALGQHYQDAQGAYLDPDLSPLVVGGDRKRITRGVEPSSVGELMKAKHT